MKAPARVVLDVSLNALTENFRKISGACSPLGVIAVLKANAYGLGMEAMAKCLARAGASAIAVAELVEGLEAVSATDGKLPVLILGTLLPDEVDEAVKVGLRLPIAGLAEAKAISESAQRQGLSAKCHLVIDTGMSRVGMHIEEAEAEIKQLAGLPGLELEGMYSHFPTANVPGDMATLRQVIAIKELVNRLASAGIKLPMLHIANSDGINNVPASYTPPFTHVRTGINLFGSFDPQGNRRLQLSSVLTLRAKLAQVRVVKAGQTIGYGRTYTAPHDMLVGTVAAGYADGLPLALSNRGSILIGGRLCPVLGRVCMDFTMVSLSQVPNAKAGDDCVCLGTQGEREISIDTWATLKGTHAYDVLCAIGSRVQRNYIER